MHSAETVLYSWLTCACSFVCQSCLLPVSLFHKYAQQLLVTQESYYVRPRSPRRGERRSANATVSCLSLTCCVVYSAQLSFRASPLSALEESGCRPSLLGSSSRSHGMDLNSFHKTLCTGTCLFICCWSAPSLPSPWPATRASRGCRSERSNPLPSNRTVYPNARFEPNHTGNSNNNFYEHTPYFWKGHCLYLFVYLSCSIFPAAHLVLSLFSSF